MSKDSERFQVWLDGDMVAPEDARVSVRTATTMRGHPIGDRQDPPRIRRRCNEPAFGLSTDRGRRILSETDISFNINKINGFYHCRKRLEKSDVFIEKPREFI